MGENYGLPYTGSKSKIAHWVIDNLQGGRVLIDAFAGGCAITHRALLSQKWQTVIVYLRGRLAEQFKMRRTIFLRIFAQGLVERVGARDD